MNSETEEEKMFWKKIDSSNRIYQSNRALIFGGLFFVFFFYQYVKLCLSYPNFTEFKIAVRTTEKTNSLIYLFAIVIGLLLIVLGIKIRKKKA